MTQQAIYESMLVFNPARTDTRTPGWPRVEAPRTEVLTFTLRDGVKWSDGQPFTAEDVVYTFELQKKILGGFDYLDTVTLKTHQR